MTFSIIIPAKNEAAALKTLLPELKANYPEAEIILVNDGSTDDTSDICGALDVVEVRHLYSRGNGAAIKSGVRKATKDIVVCMDGDGQHRPEAVEKLIAEMDKGYDLVVGARDTSSQASLARRLANGFYNRLSSWVVGHKVDDLTSGFRAFRRKKFLRFLTLLPNGFSYPTTSTMAFFRAGYSVSYVPIRASKRVGKSHISLYKDGIRFLVIIFKIGTLFAPLKIFAPVSLGFIGLGLLRYFITFIENGSFTNMSALLISMGILVFLVGLVSEQITALMYSNSDES
jgi:glycosyltransferase involved in cell wall biosynthesis